MILNFKPRKSQSDAKASVVDGKLVLSLPDALAPIVWQMDLAQAKASALEVLHDENTDRHLLKLKTPKGEVIEIAVFASRSQAVHGLMAASEALSNAHGLIRPVPNAGEEGQTVKAPKSTKARNKKWLGAVLSLAILFVLFTIWSSMIPKQINSSGAYAPTASTAGPASPQTSSGVPVSADAFLQEP